MGFRTMQHVIKSLYINGLADFMFRIGWDDMSSTVKIRRAGFDPAYDSWQSFRDALVDYRDRRVIP